MRHLNKAHLTYYAVTSALVSLILFFSSDLCFASQKKKPKASISHRNKTTDSPQNSSHLMDIPFSEKVSEYLGIPYRRGGSSERGMDCSGLTKRFFSEVFGINLPHNSYQQSKLSLFEEISPDLSALQPSDLLFFANNSIKIDHVGIYLEDGKFLHATRKGVRISSLNDSYWKKRLVALRRVKDEKRLDIYDGVSPYLITESGEMANQEIAFGYTANVNTGLDVNMEAFYTGWLLSTNPQQGMPDMGSTERLNDDIWIPVTSWKGVRASANIYPIDWLRIKPSVNMVDMPSMFKDGERNYQIYRLDVSVAPENFNWSLALAVRSLWNDSSVDALPTWVDTDMGVRLNYNFSKRMGVSLSGTWEHSPLFEDSSSSIFSHDLKDLMFNLNFSF